MAASVLLLLFDSLLNSFLDKIKTIAINIK
jgi:hypothetical protein